MCDWACENRACGQMIFAYFFNLSELITFIQIKYVMAMKFAALTKILFGIMMKFTE